MRVLSYTALSCRITRGVARHIPIPAKTGSMRILFAHQRLTLEFDGDGIDGNGADAATLKGVSALTAADFDYLF